jgi:two-component system, sensor histidine kinase and response regulator
LLQHYSNGDLDVEGALARVGGNHEIYAAVLEAFALDISQVPQLTTRSLHTLKGLAATVGARHLSGVAAQLEQALKAGAPETDHPHMTAQLQSAIDALNASLLPVLQRYKDASAPAVALPQSPLDKEQLRRDLQALCLLLDDSNMLALDAHAHLQKVYAAHLGAELHALGDAMAAFEFATAREVCQRLLVR